MTDASDTSMQASRSGRPADESRLLQLVYYGYILGSAMARALPERAVYGSAHTLGTLAARRSKRRSLVERNLARVTGLAVGDPELEKTVDDAYRSYARYWLETFRLVRETSEFFLDRVSVKNGENLAAGRAVGKGTVAVVSHLGNYDAAGAWAASYGHQLVTVAEVLRPRRMFDFFVDHRTKLGMKIYASQQGATDLLAAEASDGALVAIVGDRDLRQTGPVVDFFGEPAHLPAGPARVAAKSGAPIVVAGVYSRELDGGKRGWEIDVSDPLEMADPQSEDFVQVMTERIARRLEAFIARSPEQWQAVFQRFWKSDREPR